MATPLGRLALILFLLITVCYQPVSTMQAGSVLFAVNKQQVVGNAMLGTPRSTLEYNVHKVQQLLKDKARMCVILKDGTYGHDLSLVTPTMMQNDVRCIGTASSEETNTVRQSGYALQLMRVCNATKKGVRQATDFDTEELTGNLDMAKRLSAITREKGKTTRIHLASNPGGMSHNGSEVSTVAGLEEARAIFTLSGLKIVGTILHFPEEDAAVVKRDLTRFDTRSAQVLKITGLKRKDVTPHVANMFATLTVLESWLDMVRVGGILCGDTVASAGHKHVMTFKSAIMSISHYPKGDTVGYGRTYTLKCDSVLTSIPTGYTNGYRRVFSNAGHVPIRGQWVPVLGKTSMNIVIVNVTDLSQVTSGDEVMSPGKQGNAQANAEEVEEISGALFTEMSILWGATNRRVTVD